MGRQIVLGAAWSVMLSIVMLCGGCDKSALDTSSPEALKASMAKVSEKLDADKREKFEEAVTSLMLKHVVWSGGVTDEAAATKKVKELFDGKSVDQIIEMGEKLKAENKKEMEKLMQP